MRTPAETLATTGTVDDDTAETRNRTTHHRCEQQVRVGDEDVGHCTDGAYRYLDVSVPDPADSPNPAGTVVEMTSDEHDQPEVNRLSTGNAGADSEGNGSTVIDSSDVNMQNAIPSNPGSSLRRVTRFAAITTVVISLGSLIIFAVQPSGYARESTGPVIDVVITADRSEASAPTLDPDQGRYAFTTISVQELTVAEVVAAKMRGDDLVMVAGDSSGSPYDASTQMLLSKQRAIAAAWSLRSNTRVQTVAMVTAVTAGSPAATAGTSVGDIIEAVTGSDGVRRAVTGTNDIADAVTSTKVTFHIRRHHPTGDNLLDLSMRPINGRVGVQVTTVPSQPSAGITISTSDVGGSSAGLMFTLATFDALTSGDISGGLRISGTGTIDPNGQVGPVNGVRLKAAAAAAAGADVFFVPSINAAETGTHQGMVVVAVDDAADALTWLCGNASPSACRTTN